MCPNKNLYNTFIYSLLANIADKACQTREPCTCMKLVILHKSLLSVPIVTTIQCEKLVWRSMSEEFIKMIGLKCVSFVERHSK
jgi:hypothetical protein